MHKKLGMILPLLFVAATAAYSSTPRPIPTGTAAACPAFPPDCCLSKRISGCLICARVGCP
jgi:hypothetical protein